MVEPLGGLDMKKFKAKPVDTTDEEVEAIRYIFKRCDAECPFDKDGLVHGNIIETDDITYIVGDVIFLPGQGAQLTYCFPVEKNTVSEDIKVSEDMKVSKDNTKIQMGTTVYFKRHNEIVEGVYLYPYESECFPDLCVVGIRGLSLTYTLAEKDLSLNKPTASQVLIETENRRHKQAMEKILAGSGRSND